MNFTHKALFMLIFMGGMTTYYLYNTVLNIYYIDNYVDKPIMNATDSYFADYTVSVEHFGDYDSVHLVHDVCVRASGIFYIENDGNQILNNISSFQIHTEIRASYHNIKLRKLNMNETDWNNITFMNKPIGYILYLSNFNNLYHFMFSLIGGFKAIDLIKQSHPNLNINDIQLIYIGPVRENARNVFEILYDKILTNLTRYNSINIKVLHHLHCYKTLIIGRASQWEVTPNDFTSLSNEMNAVNTQISTDNAEIIDYIERGQQNKYLNVLLLNRQYPRRHIMNIDTLKKSLIDTFNTYIKGRQAKIQNFKQNRKRIMSDTLELDINILSVKFEDVPSLIDQFKIICNTDILVSTHGAALAWSVLTAEQSYIVELLSEISSGGQCPPCIIDEADEGPKYAVNQWGWSMYAEFTQWRYNHHICVINDANNEMERKLSRDYINSQYNKAEDKRIAFTLDETKYAHPHENRQNANYWKNIPYIISNTSLLKIADILWNKKFGTLITNNSRLWCRDFCGRALLKQNWCSKRNKKLFHICHALEKPYCEN